MSQANNPNAAVSTERFLSANPRKVFAKIILIVLMSCWLAAVSLAAETREPKTSLKQALAMAEKHVDDKKLDVSGLFLSRIYRDEFQKDRKQNCWIIIWAPKDPNVDDGELHVYIYDDGRMELGGSA
jgi:hypothetical protein